MRPPERTPIGLQLASSGKAVSRAFNAALAEAGGSLPIWLVLTALRGEQWRTQLELARSLGIEGPTLTRHLDGMERAGLVERRRDPSDRRAVRVELTDAGVQLHNRLRQHVVAFDERLRAGLGAEELEQLRAVLGRLEHNVRSGKERPD
jgi:MarR family transcriptional regulator, transcriptional regulator for hemolysin